MIEIPWIHSQKVDKIGKFKKFKRAIKGLIYDIKCGQHSGFAPCCILFYVGFWRLICEINRQVGIIKHGPIQRRYFDWAKDAGYVACPFCKALGSTRAVKECSCPPRRKYVSNVH